MRGAGRFVDDLHLPGMLHASFVRSPYAHAGIAGIDTSAAAALPGVVAVLGHAEIAPHLAAERLVTALPSPSYRHILDRRILAGDEVCHVGEPVAVVLADSRYAAEDAAGAVEIDYRPLPAASDCRAALEAGAPAAHRHLDDNLLAEYEIGYGDVEAGFAAAAHRVRVSLKQHKGLGLAIECRGAVAIPDPLDDRLTLFLSSQAPHGALRALVATLGLDESRIAVRAADLGGGFGPKLVVYPEDIVIAHAARRLNRPVKWIEDRREHFTATTQERDQYWEMEAAADRDGRLLAVRGEMIHDHGAYTARGLNLSYNAATVVPGPYRLPAYRLRVRVAVTNKVPTTPVRGAGHPQGIFAMERLVDRIAAATGLAREEVRRRNFIAADEMPYARPLSTRSGSGIVLDSGDYPACLDAALEAAGMDGFRARQAAARAGGRFLGIGLANYVKGTGRGPFEAVTVRVAPSGRVSLVTGATAIGQGTRTMLAQICADRLGVDPGSIDVVMGDTGAMAIGIGASASRQAVNAGSSALTAAGEVADKLRSLAALRLEAAPDDIELVGGSARVRGVAALSVGFGDLANAVYGTPGYALPAGAAPGLEATAALPFDALSYANGCHVAEVEADPETGHVAILRYVVVHDCGRMINPLIVDGQVQGGVAHGIGSAILERIAFDREAQPLTATLADYMIPGAAELPPVAIRHLESPTGLNPLGVKGVGESGTVPAAAAIAAAVEDALAPFAVEVTEVPIRPDALARMCRAGPAS
ncbi:MAG: xanthine dehydrogenase family protein molybdopterin-binding subunit [Defluviicoccus sp.]|nr:xanthine dehydrogenase family protein molybdopterin-binding subunit [Defluviicoccus sp.]